MGYAFENTPWHLVPDSEKLAFAVMDAQIRDSSLNPQERWAKEQALKECTRTARQERATQAWITSVLYHNQTMTYPEAEAFVTGMITNGYDTEVRDIVTLEFKPHHITYKWNDEFPNRDGQYVSGHWCPGYYDCLRCAD